MNADTAMEQEHRWFVTPTKPVTPAFVISIFVAEVLFYIALLGPAIVGISIKVQGLVPDDQKTSALGTVAGVGALAAAFGNVIFGRLSDRTTSRWGRRRPWIVGGTALMVVALFIVAVAQSVPMATLGWFLAQLGANAALAPMVATVSDQVPERQRGMIAALLGIALNVGILGGVYFAQILAHNMVMLFVLPAIPALIAMIVYAVVLPDQVLPAKPPRMSARDWIETFWVSPTRYPDFGWAWISRFLIVLSTFMFTTFRFFFVQDRLSTSADAAPGVITKGVFIYTVALVISGWFSGKLSDKLGRRKIFVAASAILFGIGMLALAHVNSLNGFYIVEAIQGFAFGIYMGIDLALVVDVLPNPDDAGKDLGVFNIANAAPQSLAPVVGAALLAINSASKQNYSLMLYSAGALAIIGALAILPVKQVK